MTNMYPNSSFKNKKRIGVIVLIIGILVISVVLILQISGNFEMVRKYIPFNLLKSDSSTKVNDYKNIPKGATDESDPNEQTNDSQVLLDE